MNPVSQVSETEANLQTLQSAAQTPLTGVDALRAYLTALHPAAGPAGEKLALVQRVRRTSRRMVKGKLEEVAASDLWPAQSTITVGDPYAVSEAHRFVASCARRDDVEAYVSMPYYAADAVIGRGADPERPSASPRGSRHDISLIPALWVDIDDRTAGAHAVNATAGEKLNWARDEALELLAGCPAGLPTVLVDSGYGLHAYWAYQTPLTPEADKPLRLRFNAWAAAVAEERQRHWEGSVTLDLNRVLRLPGSLNRKLAGDPREVTVLYADPANRVDPEALLPLLPEPRAEDLRLMEAAATGGEEDPDTPWAIFNSEHQAMYDLLEHLGAQVDAGTDPVSVTPPALSRDEQGHLVQGEERTRSAANLLAVAGGSKLVLKFWSNSFEEVLALRPARDGGYLPLDATDLLARILPPDEDGEPDRGLTARILARTIRVPAILATIEGKTYADLRAEYPSKADRAAARAGGLSADDAALVRGLDGAAGAGIWALDQVGVEPLGSTDREHGGKTYAVRGTEVSISDGVETTTVRPSEILIEHLGGDAALVLIRKVAGR